jgi:Cu(I)/Ag(I) efflux system membrane fusion protein
VGELQWDEGKRTEVSARAEGWVEELLVTRVGERVKRGQALARLYSPALLATQRELLAAPQGGQLAKAARERLRLWGMAPWEIRAALKRGKALPRVTITSPIEGVVTEKLITEGAHVNVGQALYRLANPSELWVELEVFEADVPHIKEGQALTLTSPGVTSPYTGVIEALYPTLSPVSRTARARVVVKNERGELRPGMLVQASLNLELGEALAIPTEAVIYTGSRALVFTDQGEGRLRPIEVTLGARTPKWVSVLSGLKEGDVVVSSGVFLIAAESRLRSASKHWEVHTKAHEGEAHHE